MLRLEEMDEFVSLLGSDWCDRYAQVDSSIDCRCYRLLLAVLAVLKPRRTVFPGGLGGKAYVIECRPLCSSIRETAPVATL